MVPPIAVTNRSSTFVAAVRRRIASILCMRGDIDTLLHEYQRNGPLAGVGMDLRLDEARLDLLLLVDKEVRDSQGLKQWLHDLGMVVPPPVHLAEFAAVAHDHDQGHAV